MFVTLFQKLDIFANHFFNRSKKNLSPWSDNHTNAIILLKTIVKNLPCLGFPNQELFMIVETD